MSEPSGQLEWHPDQRGYDYFDHTADIGMRVQAANLSTLFAQSALGYAELLIPDPNTIQTTATRTISVEQTRLDWLWFDMLAELIALFESEGWVFRIVNATVTGANEQWHADLELAGEPFQPDRHPTGHEVKAVTYHGLKIEERDAGWLAEVIFDI